MCIIWYVHCFCPLYYRPGPLAIHFTSLSPASSTPAHPTPHTPPTSYPLWGANVIITTDKKLLNRPTPAAVPHCLFVGSGHKRAEQLHAPYPIPRPAHGPLQFAFLSNRLAIGDLLRNKQIYMLVRICWFLFQSRLVILFGLDLSGPSAVIERLDMNS